LLGGGRTVAILQSLLPKYQENPLITFAGELSECWDVANFASTLPISGQPFAKLEINFFQPYDGLCATAPPLKQANLRVTFPRKMKRNPQNMVIIFSQVHDLFRGMVSNHGSSN
jgi:hypothetical protein